MEELRGKDRRFLRSQGNALRPAVHLGKEGITPAFLHSLAAAFAARELVKVRVEKSCGLERRQAAALVAAAAGAHLVQVLGRTLLLYRPDPEEPRLRLPD